MHAYLSQLVLSQQGSVQRQIKQYHFVTIPDFGVPEDPVEFLKYVYAIKEASKHQAPRDAPLLIHCR